MPTNCKALSFEETEMRVQEVPESASQGCPLFSDKFCKPCSVWVLLGHKLIKARSERPVLL